MPKYLKLFHSAMLLVGKLEITGKSMSFSSKRLPFKIRDGKNSDFSDVKQ